MSRESSPNPYVAGALVSTPAAGAFYHDRSYLAAQNARNWRLGFFASVACCLGLTAGIIHLANKQREYHYLDKVYESGQTETLALTPGLTTADGEVVSWILRRWIEDLRTLTTDMEANKRRTALAYRMCGEAAQKVIAAFFKDFPPEERVTRGPIFPKKMYVRQVGEKTWVLQWREEQKREDGVVVADTPWQATIEVLIAPPQTRTEREASPTGVWVAKLAWGEA
jgi:type IV secretion system protein VirB5